MTDTLTAEFVGAAKKRVASKAKRDKEGKVIRKGKNLSGNMPFRVKLYALTSTPPEAALKAAPNQVQLIIKHMAEHTEPQTGGQIVEAMIATGFKTKIDPPVLFAYYRRLMEKLGVSHVG